MGSSNEPKKHTFLLVNSNSHKNSPKYVLLLVESKPTHGCASNVLQYCSNERKF